MEKLLIIDDEKAICRSLKFTFEDEYHVYTATNLMEVETCINSVDFDMILIDLKFGDISGIELLKRIKQLDESIVVIMMTAYGSIESSIEAVKLGAYDYITKPLDMTKLRVLLKKANEYKKLNEKISYLEKEIDNKYNINGIIGKSKKMENIFYLINKVKDIDVNVLIQSESGTGKELVARAIHFTGKRKNNNFEVINCGAIPASLIESELFGYEKGSFTGAVQRRKGRFEIADGGTIFLDEIGEMDLNLQVKLLRVIEQKEVFPIGAEEGKKVDVRIIAATNKDLKKEVEKGTFREDLFFRLNVVSIKLPKLSDRKEDIPLLIEHFIKQCNTNLGKEVKGITREALNILEEYEYPGNVRELQNIIERAVALSDHEYISLNDLPRDLVNAYDTCLPLREAGMIPIRIGQTLQEIEKKVILETLRAMEGNRRKTAEILGISERNLRYKLKEYEEIV